MALNFIVNTDADDDAQIFVAYTEATTRSPRDFIRNDRVMAFTVEPVTVSPPGESTLFLSDYEATDTFELTVGPIDEPATGGTFSLDVGGTSTNLTALDYDITAAALQTPLSAAFVTEGESACTVTEISADGEARSFQIDATGNGAIPTGILTATTSQLQPACEYQVVEVDLGSASTPYQLILTIRQSAIASATPATALTTAGVTATITQAITASADKIVTVSFDAARTYGGTFSVSATVNGTTATCGVASPTMSADEFAVVLTGHPSIYYQDSSGTADNVSVSKSNGSFIVTFTGTLGSSQQVRTVTAATTANPTELTFSANHNWVTGQSVTFSGVSGITTSPADSLAGAQTVTVTAVNKVTVPVNVTGSSSPTATAINTSQPALTVTNIDLLAPKGRSGTINFNTTNLYKLSLAQSTDSFTLPMQIERTRASGEVRQIYLGSVTLKKEIINTVSMVSIPNILSANNTFTGDNTFTGVSYFAEVGFNGPILLNIVETAVSYAATSSDIIIAVTSTAAARDVTLLAASSNANKICIVKDQSGGAAANNITVKSAGGTLDGVAAATGVAIATNYGVSRWYSNGTNWFSF